MTYATMSYIQRKEVFLIELLGYEKHDNLENTYRKPGDKNFACPCPFEDLNLAMMGVEKLLKENRLDEFNLGINRKDSYVQIYGNKWELMIEVISDTPNAAIVEACIRIKRPDLFEGE